LIAHSSEVATAVRQQLRLSESPAQLLEDVKVEAAPNANVLNITASSGDRRAAANLANAFAQQYIGFRGRSQLTGLSEAQERLSSQIAALPAGSAQRATLEDTLHRLSALRAIAGGGASIIGRATPPSSPSGPSLT